jgi:ABC-2 type transport system permease protein
VALAVAGAVVGSIVPSVGDLLDGAAARDVVTALGGSRDLQAAALGACFTIMAALVTCFAIGVVARARAEEEDGRTSQLLAGGVSRATEYGTTALVALSGSAWLLLALGAGAVVALGPDVDAVGGPGRVLVGALVQVPAVWLVTALTIALFAVRSRLAVLGWALVVGFLTLREVGASLDLPGWVARLSPYDHTPQVPAESVAAAPLLTMILLAAAALALGAVVYRRRDVG